MVAVGEAEHITIPLGDQERIACVQSGLWLVDDEDEPLAIMLKSSSDRPDGEQLALQVMAPTKPARQESSPSCGSSWASATSGLITELDGTSPAFIRELLRRSALVAAEQTERPLRVTERHLREAHAELRVGASELTRALLGGGPG